MNHHRHIPVLEWAQLNYKRGILQHKSGRMLRDIIRVALPSMAIPQIERTDRDDGIIRIVLYIIRNITMIENKNPNEADTGEDIDRSTTIKAFAEQNVLDLLLTVASGSGDDFRNHEATVMETLFHLVKGVDVEEVFLTDQEEQAKKGKDITSLLRKEDAMKRSGGRPATRHNRFGTTVWIEREDGSRSFVPGQGALLDTQAGLEKIDKTKKWKKAKGADKKGVSHMTEIDVRVPLDPKARKILREFAENFIDAGFNPLFIAMRKAIDRDLDRILLTQTKQYYYVVAWFLHAERLRRAALAKQKNNVTESFSVVAGVLQGEFLVTINKSMDEWLGLALWKELQAAMRCFTQIMYTLQDMTLSPDEEDQEIAENTQNRLFYEETTLQLIPDIVRAYTRQPFQWLDDCTEMAHVHLKLLERYSSQHETMFIRSKRRQAKKKKAADLESGEKPDEERDPEELEEESQRVNSERQFDFARFEGKYLNQKCIDTFTSFLRFYKELDAPQIMRVLKFLHRIFAKRKMEVLLFRIDIVDLIYRIMKGSEALPRSHPAYKQFDEFAKHFLRRLFKKLEKEPVMFVELLFSKLPTTFSYLQFGQTPEYKVSYPRTYLDLELKPGLNHAESLGVCISALLDDNLSPVLEYLKTTFRQAATERSSFQDANAALLLEDPSTPPPPRPNEIPLTPPTEDIKTAMHENAKVRLLLKTLGCTRLLSPQTTADTPWLIPASSTAEQLREALQHLQNFTNEPPVYPDGKIADDYIRRTKIAKATTKKPAKPRKAADALSSSDDDENDKAGGAAGSGDDDIDDFFDNLDPRFAADGPLPSKGLAHKKKKPPKQPREPKRRTVDEEKAEERRLERKKKEMEKLRGIKSEMYIVDSDDGMDDEDAFFAKEREIRERGPRPIDEIEEEKRKRDAEAGLRLGTDSDMEIMSPPRRKAKAKPKPKMKKAEVVPVEDDEVEEMNDADTESDASAAPTPPRPRKRAIVLSDSEPDDTDAAASSPPPATARPRKRAMIIDSDDDE